MQIQSVPYNNFEGKPVLVSGSLTQVCHPEFNWTEFFMLKLPESKFRRNSMTSIYANYALYPSVKRTTRLCTRWLTAIGNRFLFSIKWCALSLTHATSTKATQDKGVVVERKRIPRRKRERGFRWMAIFSNATSFSALAPHRWRVRAQGLSHSARGSDTIQVPATKHYWSQIESLARNKIDLIHTSTRECTRFTPFRIRCVADSCGWQENAVAPSCHHVPTDKKDTHNEDLIGQVL